LSDVSKPNRSVVTTEDFKSAGATLMILGGRVLSFGSCAELALNSDLATANFDDLAGVLV
jgi:hypothetical protein